LAGVISQDAGYPRLMEQGQRRPTE
jgi:hypothetical protein